MIIIGLTGKKKTGKDTICDMIMSLSKDWCKKHNFISIKVGFADALYREVAIAITDLPIHLSIHDRELRIDATVAFMKEHKDNFRLMLQGWGTDYRRKLCGEDYWVNKFLNKVSKFSDNILLLVPDVRFMNELTSLGSKAQIWRVNRETGFGDIHVSESELPQDCIERNSTGLISKHYNCIIDNNGSIEELSSQVKFHLSNIMI